TEDARDVGQRDDAALVEQQHDEVAHRLRQRQATGELVHHQLALLDREDGVLERVAQLGRGAQRVGGALGVLAERVEGVLLHADLEQGLGVATSERTGDHDGLPALARASTSATYFSAILRWSSGAMFFCSDCWAAATAASMTPRRNSRRARSISAAICRSASALSRLASASAAALLRAL